jgi:hypothetical protein
MNLLNVITHEKNCKNRELKESKMMTLNEVEKYYKLKYSKNYDTLKYSNGIIINSMNAIAGCKIFRKAFKNAGKTESEYTSPFVI